MFTNLVTSVWFQSTASNGIRCCHWLPIWEVQWMFIVTEIGKSINNINEINLGVRNTLFPWQSQLQHLNIWRWVGSAKGHKQSWTLQDSSSLDDRAAAIMLQRYGADRLMNLSEVTQEKSTFWKVWYIKLSEMGLAVKEGQMGLSSSPY